MRAAVVLVFALAPVAAAGWDDLVVAYDVVGVGPFWSAQRFSSAYTPVDVDVRTTSNSDSLRYGIAVLAENGTAIYGEVGGFMMPCEARVLVRAPGLDPAAVSRPEDCTRVRVSFDLRTVGLDGTFTVVHWVAGDVGTWGTTVRIGEGTTFLAGATGPEAFAHEASDMGRYAGVRRGGDEARVVAGSLTERVEGTLFGAFIGSGIDDLSVSDGMTARDCACWFGGEPAGDYEFRLVGAGQRILLTGADVRLP